MLLGPNCLGVFDATCDLGLGVERVPVRLDRPDLAERQPGARAGHPRPARRPRFLAIRLDRATRPTSTWPRWCVSFAPARGDRADRASTPRTSATAGRSSTPRRGRRSRCMLLTVGAQRGQHARGGVSHTGALVSDARWSRPRAGRPARTSSAPRGDDRPRRRRCRRAAAAPGPRVAVLGDGGGHGAIACDVAADAGLELPLLSEELAAGWRVAAGHRRHAEPGRPGRRRRAGLPPFARTRPRRCSSRARSTACS